ncbi:MAG TPA: ABC transporter substrate-binding protein [Verrucomicrobiae bacterium]|jgi:NitT/TauT family transport system substrate-binding protein|nr:ABC transporter substrate-binding protein [Verrucomicrobiae bacterium]
MRIVGVSLAVLLGVSPLAALPRTSDAQEKKVTIGLTTRTGSNSLPFVIAEEKGLFKAEGVNAIVVVMQNQVVVTGVASKNVDYGGTFSNFVGAALAGLPVRIVMSVMDGSDHVLVTAPGIKRVEDLKGKLVGISSFGGTPHSEILTILKKHGMSEKDVTFLQIGGSSARYQSLEAGNIQAAMLVPPFNKIGRQKGFNEIISFNDVLKIPLGGLATHVEKLKEAPAEIVKMVRALIKSVDYIHNRKAEILSLMEKGWGVKDAEVREAMYRDLVGLYSRNGIAPDDVMKNVIQLVQEGRKSKTAASISDVADWTFAKKAGEELRR